MSKTETKSRNIRVNKGKGKTAEKQATAPAKKQGLFFFQMTPSGKTLRAYFTALIVAQCGAVKANTTFRLWPAANLSGHVANKRLKKVEGKGCYQLTAQGVNYLTDESNAADKETVAQLVKAVKSGVPNAAYKYEMSPLQ